MNIKIKLQPGAKLPHRSTEGAAGWDLFAHLLGAAVIRPGQVCNIPVGVSVQLPKDHYWDVRVRSGISTKRGLILANGAGVVDEDYRGIVHVPLLNTTNEEQTIYPGEKIGQALLLKYETQKFEIVDTLESTERGAGGFGSTGRV